MVVLAYTDLTAGSPIVMAVLFIAGDWDAQNNDCFDAVMFKALGNSDMDDGFRSFIAPYGDGHSIDGADTVDTSVDVGSDVDGDFVRSGHRLGTESSLGGAF